MNLSSTLLCLMTEERKAFIRQFLDNLKEIYFSLLNQNTLVGSTTSSRILVTSFYGFLLFLLYRIYLNGIGADLISLEIPDRIRNLQQLLSNRTYRPVIIRGLVLRQILDLELKHRPDSGISQLYLSLMQNPDQSIVELNLHLDKVQSMLEKIIDLGDDMKVSQATLIFPEFIYKGFRMYSCSVDMLTPKQEELSGLRKPLPKVTLLLLLAIMLILTPGKFSSFSFES